MKVLSVCDAGVLRKVEFTYEQRVVFWWYFCLFITRKYYPETSLSFAYQRRKGAFLTS
jgi:hypothetical protein